MTESGTCGVAFVGTGNVAHMHARAVQAIPGARLVGGYNRTPAKAEAFFQRYEGRAFGSFAELLGDPEVEAVDVLTRMEDHVETAIACLAAGKHVLCQKPLGRNLAEIESLKAAAAKTDRVLMPAHNLIYGPWMERIKGNIEAGKLGRISSLWIIYNMAHSEEFFTGYADILREVCTHHIYSTFYLLGRPKRVRTVMGNVHFPNLKRADQVMMTCEMADGAIANLWCGLAANDPTSNPWTFVYKVLGTEGGINHTWNDAVFFDPDDPDFGIPHYYESFRYAYEHFLDRCIAKGEAPLSTIDDALDVERFIEAIEHGLERGEDAATPEYGRARD